MYNSRKATSTSIKTASNHHHRPKLLLQGRKVHPLLKEITSSSEEARTSRQNNLNGSGYDENSPFPCIVTSHQSYERDNASCSNYLQVRKIFNDANEKNPGRVRLVINGHHHHDNIRILDGIVYFDLNSASYEWVPKAHDKYPPEIANKHRCARNTVMYNDPISAIITMTTDGQLTIEGQKSSFLNGITREMTGNSGSTE